MASLNTACCSSYLVANSGPELCSFRPRSLYLCLSSSFLGILLLFLYGLQFFLIVFLKLLVQSLIPRQKS